MPLAIAIIMMHEVDDSSESDEETAKGLVAMSIQSFYEPKHLQKVENKYWHWEEYLHYGFRGRVMATPDNLMRFRTAVDTTRKEVQEEINAMLHAVRNISFIPKSKYRKNKYLSVSTSWKLIVLICALISAFLYAYQRRYMRMGDDAVMDTWKGTLLVPNNVGKYVPWKQ